MKSNLSKINKRYIGSLIILPIILAIFLGGIVLKSIMGILTIIAIIEFSRSLSIKEIKINKYLILLFTIIYYVGNLKYLNLYIYAFFIILLLYSLSKNSNIVDISLSFISIFYIVIPFSFIFILNNKNIYLPWIIFLSAWSTDTIAYIIGKNFGKHKISKRISPNKTLEGSLAGVIGCVIVILIFGYIFKDNLKISMLNLFILSIFTSISAQLGDLIASSIKRFTGIKDFGNLIPGHGGILDRFDSILMISVTVFMYAYIFM